MLTCVVTLPLRPSPSSTNSRSIDACTLSRRDGSLFTRATAATRLLVVIAGPPRSRRVSVGASRKVAPAQTVHRFRNAPFARNAVLPVVFSPPKSQRSSRVTEKPYRAEDPARLDLLELQAGLVEDHVRLTQVSDVVQFEARATSTVPTQTTTTCSSRSAPHAPCPHSRASTSPLGSTPR